LTVLDFLVILDFSDECSHLLLLKVIIHCLLISFNGQLYIFCTQHTDNWHLESGVECDCYTWTSRTTCFPAKPTT